MSEIPTNAIGDALYLVGSPVKPKWLVLSCPCGCGERLDVSLMKSARPHWRLTRRMGRVSLWPSVWVDSDKCDCHFWLRNNKVLIL